MNARTFVIALLLLVAATLAFAQPQPSDADIAKISPADIIATAKHLSELAKDEHETAKAQMFNLTAALQASTSAIAQSKDLQVKIDKLAVHDQNATLALAKAKGAIWFRNFIIAALGVA